MRGFNATFDKASLKLAINFLLNNIFFQFWFVTKTNQLNPDVF